MVFYNKVVIYGVHLLMVLLQAYLSCCSNIGLESTVKTVWALQKKVALLRCKKSIPTNVPVMWLHPHTGIAISVNSNVMIPQLMNRFSITGNASMGEYNLMIRYVTYPDDVGLWQCISLGMTQSTNLTVIVPPIEETPSVNPSIIMDVNHEAWTFTCSAQYAIPPVNLSWVKLSGPDMKYDVTLPNYIVSSQHRVAVTLRLIVSPLNFGSVFQCKAMHPSFDNWKDSETVVYAPPLSQSLGADSEVQYSDMSHENIEKMIQSSKMSQPKYTLGTHEKASILFIILFCIFLLVMVFVMCKYRRHWQWNDTSLNVNIEKKRRAKCKFCIKVSVWFILSLFIILSLGLAFPVYMKGITIPLLGTDMLMSVSAGSALWMDCGSKVQPIKSLLQITWHYNFQPFYRQYMVRDENIGFPNNSTLGYILGMRTKSYRIGQISVWPILPGEDGIYSCEVAALKDSSGDTKIKRKTFGVFVVTGPYLNQPLLILLAVALTSAILVSVITACHMITCQNVKQKDQPYYEANLARRHPVERQTSLKKVFEKPLMMGSVT